MTDADPLQQLLVKLEGDLTTVREENLRLRKEKEELEARATRDSLTGALNLGATRDLLAQELERARRSEKPASVAFLDIDNFGSYNKRHGQKAGDKALLVFLDALRSRLRKYDVLGRLGGEEFLLIFPDTCELEAYEVMGRLLRSSAADMTITLDGETERITFSAGIASSPDAGNVESIIDMANQAEMAAKAAGKARIYLNLCGALLSPEEVAEVALNPAILALIRDHRKGLIRHITTRDGAQVPFHHLIKLARKDIQVGGSTGDFKIIRDGDATPAFIAYSRGPENGVLSPIRDTADQILKGMARAGLPILPNPETYWQYPGLISALNLLITHSCPMNCVYCSQSHEGKEELPVEVWIRAVDEVVQNGERRGVIFWLTGGEPLTKRQLSHALLRHAADSGMYSTINTNAMLVTDDNVGELLATGVKSINVSLDSSTPAIEDMMTRTTGAYGRVLGGLTAVGRNRQGTELKRVIINYVLTRENVHLFAEFVQTMCRIRENVGTIIFDDINPLPVKDAPDLYLTVAQIQEFNQRILPQVLYLAPRYGLSLLGAKARKIFAADVMNHGERTIREFLASTGVYYGFDGMMLPCATAMVSATILPSGEVFPCTYHREAKPGPDRLCIGNIKDSSLREMHERYFEYLRRLPAKPDGAPNSICQRYCSPDIVGMRSAVRLLLHSAGTIR